MLPAFREGTAMRLFVAAVLLGFACTASAQDHAYGAPAPSGHTALVIHGAAGVLERGAPGADQEQAIRDPLGRALDAGHAVLAGGGSALDAVVAAVALLEDSPHFNAGRGAVFNAQGRH